MHILIASTFIPNPGNFELVNHLDGNKLDYRPYNLEWIGRADNTSHAHGTGLHSRISTLLMDLKHEKAQAAWRLELVNWLRELNNENEKPYNESQSLLSIEEYTDLILSKVPDWVTEGVDHEVAHNVRRDFERREYSVKELSVKYKLSEKVVTSILEYKIMKEE